MNIVWINYNVRVKLRQFSCKFLIALIAFKKEINEDRWTALINIYELFYTLSDNFLFVIKTLNLILYTDCLPFIIHLHEVFSI